MVSMLGKVESRCLASSFWFERLPLSTMPTTNGEHEQLHPGSWRIDGRRRERLWLRSVALSAPSIVANEYAYAAIDVGLLPASVQSITHLVHFSDYGAPWGPSAVGLAASSACMEFHFYCGGSWPFNRYALRFCPPNPSFSHSSVRINYLSHAELQHCLN